MSDIKKLDFTDGVPSFDMKEFRKNKRFPYVELNEIMKIVPAETDDRDNYLLVIYYWLVSNIAVPIIKEYLTKLINKKLKININNYTNFSDFKNIIDNKK